MPRKPHATEEEYFAREQALKREKLAREEASRKIQEEKEALKKLHWMRCPKCGQELTSFVTPRQKLHVERCESCQGIWLDKEEWEILAQTIGGTKSATSLFLSFFKPSKKDVPAKSKNTDEK